MSGFLGKYATEITIAAGQFFAIVSYVITIGILTSQVLSTIIVSEKSAFSIMRRPSIDAALIIIIFVASPCLVRHFGSLLTFFALQINLSNIFFLYLYMPHCYRSFIVGSTSGDCARHIFNYLCMLLWAV